MNCEKSNLSAVKDTRQGCESQQRKCLTATAVLLFWAELGTGTLSTTMDPGRQSFSLPRITRGTRAVSKEEQLVAWGSKISENLPVVHKEIRF
jgi:hypothetical protein